jgi:hypothetical protein
MSIALPDSTTRTTNPEQATLVVLGQGTNVDGDQVVEWLETGVPVGVVGDPALETLAGLVRAGNIDNAFDADGIVAGGARSAKAAAFYPALDAQELHTYTSFGPAEDSVDRWDLEGMVKFVDENDRVQ